VASVGYIAYTQVDVARSGPTSPDLRIQRRARVLVDVVCHGSAGSTPDRDGRRRAQLRPTLLGGRQRRLHPRPVRPGNDRPGRNGHQPRRVRHKDEEFWGVDADVDQVSRFIAQYVTDQQRWRSPNSCWEKATARRVPRAWSTRCRTLVDGFQRRLLVSVATDIEALFAVAGNDRPYPLYLPTTRPSPGSPPDLRARDLKSLVEDARAFAVGPYLSALMKGDA